LPWAVRLPWVFLRLMAKEIFAVSMSFGSRQTPFLTA
jgi:hypothetical protein